MKKRRVAFSDAAIADILEQSDWYVAQSRRPLAQRWEKAVTSAIALIVNHPAAGAQCSFRALELHDVKRTTVRGFPRHLLFYRFDEEEIFILRVVHGARDSERLFS